MNSPARSNRGIIALIIFQAVVIAVSLFCVLPVWPRDDALTYLEQGLNIYLGGFPPDPGRPVFYPFFLASGMALVGFKPLLLRILQSFFLLATTALTYRLARNALNKKAALFAAAVMVVFPDFLFFHFRFYREAMTAFFFILSLNLVELMLQQPAKAPRAVLAGIAAGMLCLIKPEFSSMFALFAVFGAAAAIKKRDLKTHALPWIICGAMALVTVSPSILAARAHFNEWIFINTYKGYNYSLSYCGDLKRGDLPSIKDFQQYDKERYSSVHPLANNVLFFSDDDIPYTKRDNYLLGKAWTCIKKEPGDALWMVTSQ